MDVISEEGLDPKGTDPRVEHRYPEPVSPSYRSRVREVSPTYRSQPGKHLPGLNLRARLVGHAYAAFVVDAYSRMIVGWRVAPSMITDLVLDTLEMAIWRRNEMAAGVVCHSNGGSQPGQYSLDPLHRAGRIDRRSVQDRADLA